MTMCLGFTLKNEPCKRKVKEGMGYCHQHDKKVNSNSASSLPEMMAKLSLAYKTHQRTKPSPGWLYVYTTLNLASITVHDTPLAKFSSSKLSKFASRLRNEQSEYVLLKVGKTRKLPQKRVNQWRNKCHEETKLLGAWHTSQPDVVERSVHAELRGLFGHGQVQCGGCKTSHTEWFLVSRKKIKRVMQTIDYWCGLYPDYYD